MIFTAGGMSGGAQSTRKTKQMYFWQSRIFQMSCLLFRTSHWPQCSFIADKIQFAYRFQELILYSGNDREINGWQMYTQSGRKRLVAILNRNYEYPQDSRPLDWEGLILAHLCYMYSQSYLPWLEHSNYTLHSALFSNTISLCKIWGFHGGDYEEYRLLGCYAVWLL
jgi:hypothetical protein